MQRPAAPAIRRAPWNVSLQIGREGCAGLIYLPESVDFFPKTDDDGVRAFASRTCKCQNRRDTDFVRIRSVNENLTACFASTTIPVALVSDGHRPCGPSARGYSGSSFYRRRGDSRPSAQADGARTVAAAACRREGGRAAHRFIGAASTGALKSSWFPNWHFGWLSWHLRSRLIFHASRAM